MTLNHISAILGFCPYIADTINDKPIQMKVGTCRVMGPLSHAAAEFGEKRRYSSSGYPQIGKILHF